MGRTPHIPIPRPGGMTVIMLALIAILIVLRWGVQRVGHVAEERLKARTPKSDAAPVTPAHPAGDERLIGEIILEHYAEPATLPQEDLVRLAHALNNFALLVKGDNPLPQGSNEELAAALRGRNRAQLRFLPETHPVFNAPGQLVDRWGTPLFFHAVSRDRLDIRSAGPDKVMWTEDDLHRRHDGRFLRGEELNAASLFTQ